MRPVVSEGGNGISGCPCHHGFKTNHQLGLRENWPRLIVLPLSSGSVSTPPIAPHSGSQSHDVLNGNQLTSGGVITHYAPAPQRPRLCSLQQQSASRQFTVNATMTAIEMRSCRSDAEANIFTGKDRVRSSFNPSPCRWTPVVEGTSAYRDANIAEEFLRC
jgi:hypothetical protein